MHGTIIYTLRQFRLSPVFTAAATLTLAVGIGGTTAIFTLIHAVMLRSLPVSDPALLYRIGDGGGLLRRRRPARPVGNVFFPTFRASKGGNAGVRRASRLPSGRQPAEHSPARVRKCLQSSALIMAWGGCQMVFQKLLNRLLI